MLPLDHGLRDAHISDTIPSREGPHREEASSCPFGTGYLWHDRKEGEEARAPGGLVPLVPETPPPCGGGYG